MVIASIRNIIQINGSEGASISDIIKINRSEGFQGPNSYLIMDVKEPQSDIIQMIGQQGHNFDLMMEVKWPQSGTQFIFSNY